MQFYLHSTANTHTQSHTHTHTHKHVLAVAKVFIGRAWLDFAALRSKRNFLFYTFVVVAAAHPLTSIYTCTYIYM